MLGPARFMTSSRRPAVPREQFGLLVEPPAGRIAEALLSAPPPAETRILDVPLAQLRESLRGRLGLRRPLIVTGHQAEFFHAGVLAKAIAADALARQCGGQAVFVTVDSDVVRDGSVALPTRRRGALVIERVAIPGCRPNLAAEWQPARPVREWLAFSERLAELNAIEGPTLLETFVDGWRSAGDETTQVQVLGAGKAAVLAGLGGSGLPDVPVSGLAGTPEFRAWAAHLMLHAEEFAAHYNRAQTAYRERYHIRSPLRPVPALLVRGRMVETPLWVSRRGEPRRRLAVCPHDDRLELLADDEAIGELPRTELERFECHRQPWSIERAGWQVRPRALALSAFLRQVLADVFIHGTGGVRYDEITEGFVQSFWRIRLPPVCCVTATLYPSLGGDLPSPGEALAARHVRRDLLYNPQRHLRGIPPELSARRAGLVERSRMLRCERPRDREARRRVFEEIRRVSALMREAAGGELRELEQRSARLADRAGELEIALNREYFFALHSRSAMIELARRIRVRLGMDTWA
jgi:hypothetical protein